ncbi:MAG: TROVE domain-containing protein, partial [Nitrospiraceae bacterium]|nr:TROVE domain-containing protein [Nitrospiraceae bacterium]
VLGAEGGTFYVGEQKLVEANAKAVVECLKEDGPRTVLEILDVSVSGRAPKNEPAIFALALATVHGDAATKATAYRAIPKVCRIGTHLFHFCQAVQDLRGWSRGLRGGVGAFYADRDEADLAYQLVKYRQRDGWTHKDVIKLAHPKMKDPIKNALIHWALGKTKEGDDSDRHAMRGPVIAAFEEVQRLGKEAVTATVALRIIELVKAARLPWEALPTEALTLRPVWEALAPTMPLGALVRNLGRMASLGMLESNLQDETKAIAARLVDREAIRKARLHPLGILNALLTYKMGHAVKGSLAWRPTSAIWDALEAAFYLAFDEIEPTGKNWLLGLDVSGSMTGGSIGGTLLTPAAGTAVMAMVTARVEKSTEIYGFTSTFQDLGISAKDTLHAAIQKVHKSNFGSTDCSLPMTWALERKIPVDAFMVLTDNETYAGKMHPFQALQQYRKAMGRPAKLIVCGMTSTGFSLADPSDGGSLDVVGFDTTTPQVIANFVR